MKARHAAILAVIPLLTAACGDGTPFAPQEDISAPGVLESFTYGATLLECPASSARSGQGTIGVQGGVLEVGNHRMVVPALAVLSPTPFTFSVPPSNYMEVSITAGGADHFTFRHPVEVSISYERCTRANTEKRDLRVYYIDPATKRILEDMGGVDDKVARRVTFRTGHLSGYSVGDNRGGDGPGSD
jgi:hypothetical protein